MFKRKLTKVTAAIKNILKSGKNTKKFLMCKECDKVEVEVNVDTGAVTCAYCVQRLVAPPEGIKPKEQGEKFPRGWALKATYIHTDGRIFEKGIDTGRKYEPESVEIKPKSKTPIKVTKKAAKKKSVSKKKTPKRRK